LKLPADALQDTVARYNAHASQGIDPDFGKGGTAYNRYLGDPDHRPNPCLAPLGAGPYYAVQVVAGDIGTAWGLATDEHARILDRHGAPIDGLYAAGNDMHSGMGGAYPGPGITLGPALTFGWLAARHLAGASPATLPEETARKSISPPPRRSCANAWWWRTKPARPAGSRNCPAPPTRSTATASSSPATRSARCPPCSPTTARRSTTAASSANTWTTSAAASCSRPPARRAGRRWPSRRWPTAPSAPRCWRATRPPCAPSGPAGADGSTARWARWPTRWRSSSAAPPASATASTSAPSPWAARSATWISATRTTTGAPATRPARPGMPASASAPRCARPPPRRAPHSGVPGRPGPPRRTCRGLLFLLPE